MFNVNELSEDFSCISLSEDLVSCRASSFDFKSFSSEFTHNLDKESVREKFDVLSYFNSNSKFKGEIGNPPPGLLYLSSNSLIFQRPPTKKTVTWCPFLLESVNSNTEYTTYEIPIPWQVYFVHFTPSESYNIVNEVYMGFSNTQIHSFDQEIYAPPLNNFYTDGRLCKPHYESFKEISEGTQTAAGIMQNAYNQVWDTLTNNDLTASFLSFIRYFSYPSIHLQELGGPACFKPSNEYFSNTVAKNLSISKNFRLINSSSYYSPSSFPADFYQSWSMIPLSEVCSLNWSSLDPVHLNNPAWSQLSRLVDSDFLKDTPVTFTQELVDNECCEDCQYYDQDGDIVEGECSEEGQCSCHYSRTALLSKWFIPDAAFPQTYLFNLLEDNYPNLLFGHRSFLDVYNRMIKTVNDGLPQNETPLVTLNSHVNRLSRA